MYMSKLIKMYTLNVCNFYQLYFNQAKKKWSINKEQTGRKYKEFNSLHVKIEVLIVPMWRCLL